MEKIWNRKTILLVLALILVISTFVSATSVTNREVEDTNEYIESEVQPSQLANSPWPSFGQNQKNHRRSPYNTSHVDGTEKWTFETGDDILSSPAIGADGTIYVGSHDNNLYAFAPDGTERWNFTTGGDVYSSPAIGSDGTIYVGSQDNNVYAINPDGTEGWNFTTGGSILSSPTIADDGTIYVGSHDGHLYAINPDGTERWNFTTGNEVWSSPGIGANGLIYIGSNDGNLYAVNQEDGTEEWSFQTGNNFWTTPTIADDGTIYVSDQDGDNYNNNHLYALNPNGSEKWRLEIGWAPTVNPAIGDDGTIYLGGGDHNLYAVNPDGSEKWTFDTGDFVQSAPAIGSDGTIYIGSNNNNLHAMNPDGTEKWNLATGGDVISSPSIAEDGTVYVGSRDNNLYAITGEHTLTLNEPTGEGTVEVNGSEITSWPYQGVYEHGTEVTLEAIAANDWYFEEWTGDYTGVDNPTTITMDSEKEITAAFGTDQVSYELQINIDGEGTVDVDGTEFNDGDTDTYVEGTTLTLEAIPADGWSFVEWTGDETGTSTTMDITMDEDKTITANFEGEPLEGDYSDSISDPTEDVLYYYESDNEWGWRENVDRPDIDITQANIEGNNGDIVASITVKGTVPEETEVWYSIYLEDENEDSYEIVYTEGTGYLQHPNGGMSIEPTGFGTSTFEVRFSPGEIGNPDLLEITEVQTHDWIDAEGEGEYYYDTAGPAADEPGTDDESGTDDSGSEGEVNPEGILDEIIARGMMCLVVAIIIPIVLLVVIIVVVMKLLSSEDEGSQQPPQQGPQQGPPPEQQQAPQQQQQQPTQQEQPPSPPEDQGGSGETPPPPPEDK